MNDWTLCSEKLPDKYGRYLVVYPISNDELYINILWYDKPMFPEKKDKPCFYITDDEWGFDTEYDDVIAWMPLPDIPSIKGENNE